MTYKDSNRERKGRVEGERNRGVGVGVREASESERSATDTSQARVLLPVVIGCGSTTVKIFCVPATSKYIPGIIPKPLLSIIY